MFDKLADLLLTDKLKLTNTDVPPAVREQMKLDLIDRIKDTMHAEKVVTPEQLQAFLVRFKKTYLGR